jgi:hypothetical protein
VVASGQENRRLRNEQAKFRPKAYEKIPDCREIVVSTYRTKCRKGAQQRLILFILLILINRVQHLILLAPFD